MVGNLVPKLQLGNALPAKLQLRSDSDVMAWSPDHAISRTEVLRFFVETVGRLSVAVRRPRHNMARNNMKRNNVSETALRRDRPFAGLKNS